MEQQVRGTVRVKTGVVTSNKMNKTVVVTVTRKVQHPIYKKFITRRNKFVAHDEKSCQMGDTVSIIETRPMSKTKRWRVLEIVTKAKGAYNDGVTGAEERAKSRKRSSEESSEVAS